ncbi:hypothetical protein AB0C96_42330 [Streptomyces sp. NPDC048506]|uniref:hypothetical protein n=1 Tax=Streptomyces sp. NPDC048506 TaxID=3155028 RepID=UPI0034377A3E
MRRNRQPRRLVVGEETWHWSVRHRHAPHACSEVLSLHHGGTRTTLRLVFRAQPGRMVPDGLLHSGGVGDRRGGVLNLHEPGVVRRFVDEVTARGLVPPVAREAEWDGWPLYDTVVGRHDGA